MTTSWVRLWHDMPTDPKFRTIARAAGQPLATVVAVFTLMLTDASANATERGRTHATDEDIASAFDIEESAVAAIRSAMQGRVLEGAALAGWDKRQPKREDDSAARAKAWRDKAKGEAQGDGNGERTRTQANAPERPDTDTDTDTERSPLSPPGGEAGEMFDRIEKVFPRSPHYNQAKAERSFKRQPPADQAALVSKAESYGPWWEADQQRRGRTIEEGLQFAPPLDKWIGEGAWRSFEAPAPAEPAPALPVLRSDDPLIPAIEAIRGKPIIFGTRGTVTVTHDEIARAKRGGAG